jgi:hypothetical protein
MPFTFDAAQPKPRIVYEDDAEKAVDQEKVDRVAKQIQMRIATGGNPLVELGGELGASMGTSTVAVPAGGVAGILGTMAGMFPGGESQNDKGVRWKEAVESFLSYTPKGQAAEKFAETVAPTAEYVSQKVDDGIYAASGGSPIIATALKTAIYGAADLAGAKNIRGIGALKSPSRDRLKGLDSHLQQSYGIDLKKPNTVPAATEARAKGMTQGVSEKAENFDVLLSELRKKEAASRNQKNAAWDQLKSVSGMATVDAAPMARTLRRGVKQLKEDGYDAASPKIKATLKDIKALNKTDSLGNPMDMKLTDLLQLRRRLNRRIGKKNSITGWTDDQSALMTIKKTMTDKLDSMLEAEALKAGPNGSVDKDVFDAWRAADAETSRHRKDFTANKTVRKLLTEAADSEQAYNLIFGANAIGAKTTSLATIKKLKEVLGPTHPSITDIRKAAIRDIMLPALDESPDLAQLSRNLYKAVANRSELYKELGVSIPALDQLRRMAQTSLKVMASHPTKIDKKFFTKALTSVLLNNTLARHAARTTFVQRVLLQHMGVDEVSANELREMLVGKNNVPIVERAKPELTHFLAATAADASDFEYEEDEE